MASWLEEKKATVPTESKVSKQAKAEIKKIKDAEPDEINPEDCKDITVVQGTSVDEWIKLPFIGITTSEHQVRLDEEKKNSDEKRVKIRFLKCINMNDVEKGSAVMEQVGKIGFKPGKDAKYELFSGLLHTLGGNTFKSYPFGTKVITPETEFTIGHTFFFISDQDDYVYTYSLQGAYASGAVPEIQMRKWHTPSIEKIPNESINKTFYKPHFTVTKGPEFKEEDIVERKRTMVKWMGHDIQRRTANQTW